MKPKQAIKILERQRDRISDPKFPNDETWVFQTTEHIKDFFGESSSQFAFISQFSFSVIGHPSTSDEKWRYELDSKKRKAERFIDTCIETINDKGLYKPPKQNFLAGLGDTWLVIIFGTVVPALFFGGVWIGEYRSDIKNIELRRHLQSARDSLSNMTTTIMKNSVKDSGSIATDENKSEKDILTNDDN